MKIQVLLFGIASELVGESSVNLNLPKNTSVNNFKALFTEHFPKVKTITSYAIAINESYAKDNDIIKDNDTIAIIPPVSGG